jgi:hypothetical protein
MKNIFSKKQLIFKLVFSFLLLAFLITFFKAWENWLSLTYFVLSYFFGVIFLFLDEQFLYKFYQEKIGSEVNNDLHLLMLASRNFLFLLALPFLSIFVLTSSGSIFGIALIMSINFYLLIEMWQLRDEFLLFADRFLAMSKIQTSRKLVHKICWFALAYFAFLIIILLF